MCIFLAVTQVNSLAVDTQTGELFFSMGTEVGKIGNGNRVIVIHSSYSIYGIAVDPVLR